MNQRYVRMSYRVHLGWDLTQSHRFHPKLYYWTTDYQRYTAVVGSSNLTQGGLFDNVEVNSVLTGEKDESPIAKCIDIFDSIFAHQDLVEPNQLFVEKYRELYYHAQSGPLQTELPDDLRELYRELEELVCPTPVEPPVDWRPRNQLEFVVKALQNLEPEPAARGELRDDGDDFVRLNLIYEEVERLARHWNVSYKMDTLDNSLRRVLNNDIPKGGREGTYFIRQSIGSGRYRLSDGGRAFIRRMEQEALGED